MLAAVLLNALLGGIWRRVLGGWGGFKRSYIVAAGFLLTWPAWITLPWFWAAPVTGAMMLFWTMGHRFDRWTIVLRYPLFGAAYPLLRAAGVRDWTAVAEVVIGGSFWGAFALVLIF